MASIPAAIPDISRSPEAPRLYNDSMGIGSILVDRGVIDDEQLTEAIHEQNRTGERLDHVLVRLGLVKSGDVLEAIGHQFAMPIVDLNAVEVKPETLRML